MTTPGSRENRPSLGGVQVDGVAGVRGDVSVAHDSAWFFAARSARRLAWASLAWMTAEGFLGVVAGLQVWSIALIGWALGSAVEGLASLIVIWRFSGSRALSEHAERTAQKLVALSFWLIAPLIAVEAIRDLYSGHRVGTTVLGLALTASSLLVMPALGRAKHRLGAQLESATTAGEGTQNYLCAAQAAAVLVGLALTASWRAGTWVDPVVALGIAGWSAWEGRQTWLAQGCGC